MSAETLLNHRISAIPLETASDAVILKIEFDSAKVIRNTQTAIRAAYFASRRRKESGDEFVKQNIERDRL
jgi:predicted DsbA family dithiol-disulfide isomerase